MSPRSASHPAHSMESISNIFRVVGLASSGRPIQRVRFRWDMLLQFFERAAPAVVGME